MRTTYRIFGQNNKVGFLRPFNSKLLRELSCRLFLQDGTIIYFNCEISSEVLTYVVPCGNTVIIKEGKNTGGETEPIFAKYSTPLFFELNLN